MFPRLNKWDRKRATMCLLMIFAFSCGREDVYEGIYKAQDGKSSKYAGSQIELMEKGQAVWRTLDDEVSFRWEIKDSEIWLSTKSGGIIIGKIHDDTIEVTLPGAKTMQRVGVRPTQLTSRDLKQFYQSFFSFLSSSDDSTLQFRTLFKLKNNVKINIINDFNK